MLIQVGGKFSQKICHWKIRKNQLIQLIIWVLISKQFA